MNMTVVLCCHSESLPEFSSLPVVHASLGEDAESQKIRTVTSSPRW